ncbi:carboxypeptidase M32 [Halomarina rubra]|uniref:Metal-dependent carboxypeptidase n=1 Tax=Halomarina rubra TaxID=2071873 RepID=A0ABD6APW5_9EURY|nr:carboxypeptidase M32 [Halomarina rubra]
MASTDTDTESDAPDPYVDLLDHTKKLAHLNDANGVVYWDLQVMMPEGGMPARSKQLSALSSVTHDLQTDPVVGEHLDALDAADLTDERAAVVRELRRSYERAVDVPGHLVEELSETQANAQQTWQGAKADSDFEAFAPTLESLRDLHRDRAEHIDGTQSPYVTMYEDGAPYLPLETVEDIFDTLREELVPLIADIREHGDDLPDPFDGTYPDDDQMALCEATLDTLGYDRSRGRLDTAPHPFMVGTQFDARVTTRFDESDPLGAVMSTTHEYGHASYQLGLRQDAYGTPLGMSRSSGVHESQSRFWENHVGRTRPFWESFAPTVNEHLGTDLDAETMYQSVNRIYPDNLIRVEADELTYHFHIILRSEIDRAFVEGDVDVEEIPDLWNEKMEEYLGVTPPNDATGCLQDIHWSSGFASFQNYTVGSVLAAQLNAAIREDLDVDALVREGEFDPIREWMGERVHEPGCRYETPELVEHATGEPLTADYFVEYAKEKFGDLYGL